jgi:cobalt/nickel transport system permease protein
MHIPDGYLSPTVVIIAFIVTLVFWALSFLKIKGSLDEKQVPLMGLLTALFFAAQMINYPIIFGTTAHLIGGASLGIILGPWAGCISMTIIIVLQALLFGDGGLTTLGANVLNMGVISVFIPAIMLFVYNKVSKGKGLMVGIFISAFVADVVAAIFAGVELGFSQPVFQYGLSVAVPAMAINHSIIGVIEGAVTAVLVAVLIKVRPDVLKNSFSLKFLPQIKSRGENDE